MLAVGAGLAPIHRTGFIVNDNSIDRDMLAITLHRQLLQISGKSLEILLVRQNSDGMGAEEIVVPHADETHEHREILSKWRILEMLIHLMEPVQHVAEIVG